MATSIFELFGTIMVDNSKADESITKTESKAESLAKSFAGGAKKVAKFGAAVVGAGTAAVGSITKLASETASTMDTIDKASQRMQISAEQYQEFAHAAELSGVEMSTLETAAKKLDGDMSFDQAMAEIYALETAEERAAKAAELFGEGVAYKMTPMLNASAEEMSAMKQEAHDLGLVMSEENVKAGAALNDTLGNLKSAFGAIVTQLGASLMPIVQKFADLLLTYMPKVQALFDRLSPILTEMFDRIMPVLFDVADAILPIIFDVLEALLPIFTQIVEAVLPIIADILQKIAPILGQIAEHVMPLIADLLGAIIPILDAVWPLVSTLLDLALSIIDPLLKLVENLLPPITTLIQGLTPIIETIAAILTPIVELISAILAPVLNTIVTLLTPLTTALQILNPVLEILNGILKPILDLINLILSPIMDFVNFLFGDITSGVEGVTSSLGDGGLLGGLGSVASFLFGDFSEAFDLLGGVVGEATSLIGDAFHGIVNFIDDPKAALGDFFDWAGNKLSTLKDSLSTIVSGIGELIENKKEQERIKETQAKIDAQKEEKRKEGWRFVDMGNGSSWVTRVDEPEYQQYLKDHGYTDETVPQLAEGAVLEPNRPFLAVVGDQTQGTNVEAPLETIKQALREELEQIVINVMFNVNNDTDKMYEILQEKSWVERRRTSTEQFG